MWMLYYVDGYEYMMECVICGNEILPDFHLMYRGEGVCFHCAAFLEGVTKMTEKKEESRKFKPRFLGFTEGMKEGESMGEFVKRMEKEGVV